MNSKRYFTSTGAAEAIGCTSATLRRYERDGELFPARDSAGRRVYTLTDVARAREIKREREEARRRAFAAGRNRWLAERP